MTDSGSAVWLPSVEQFDDALVQVAGPSDVLVCDGVHADWRDAVRWRLTKFLLEHYAGGYILVKTSTTGARPPSHEVSSELLGLVLSAAVAAAPGRVVLADGPVYARYLEECRRLGWQGIAETWGAAVADLNEDDAEEVAPNWPVSRRFLAADVVVNLTKAKTHRRFGVSLAEKALLGVLVGRITGYPKLAGRHDYVTWLLQRLACQSPPIFSVIDGVRGIQGNGPLDGRPTASNFLCLGQGLLGPDTRAIIEMGFDPALVPGLIRPMAPPVASVRPVDWSSLRTTSLNFLPARSCGWLYRSLERSRRRDRHYRNLVAGARDCWPSTVVP